MPVPPSVRAFCCTVLTQWSGVGGDLTRCDVQGRGSRIKWSRSCSRRRLTSLWLQSVSFEIAHKQEE